MNPEKIKIATEILNVLLPMFMFFWGIFGFVAFIMVQFLHGWRNVAWYLTVYGAAILLYLYI